MPKYLPNAEVDRHIIQALAFGGARQAQALSGGYIHRPGVELPSSYQIREHITQRLQALRKRGVITCSRMGSRRQFRWRLVTELDQEAARG